MNFREFFELCIGVNEVVIVHNAVEERFRVEEGQLVINLNLCAKFYSESCEEIFRYRAGNQAPDILKSATTATIINGEFHTAWNVKLELISSLDIVQELHMTCLSLMIHRKSSIGWFYLYTLLKQDSSLIDSFRSKLELLLERHPRNYYTWMYLFKIFKEIYFEDYKTQEFYQTLSFCESHIKDSSSFHYLLLISIELNKLPDLFLWAIRVCQSYYGPDGLYIERSPPGYENFCNLLKNLRSLNTVSDSNLSSFIISQRSLGRDNLLNKYFTQ
jgi:hypothetical protein